jgi:hypothetical protein
MNAFFHHVGDDGVDRDFPKTVYSEISIKKLQEEKPDFPNSLYIISQLQKEFPSGSFNVWGIPAGAYPVVRAMQPGDLVLLIDNARWSTGQVRAMGLVKVFLAEEMTELSRYFWGENRFPFVFFFKAEHTSLTWLEFLEMFGYKQNWNPRGLFYHLSEERLGKMKPEDLYDFLKSKQL